MRQSEREADQFNRVLRGGVSHPFPLPSAPLGISRRWTFTLPVQATADELRTASEPCCAGTGDCAGGSAVVGLDLDAGLNAATVPCDPSAESAARSTLV